MKIIEGDILDVKEGIIVHGCNCQGVMGSGVAKAIRDKYSGVFKAYEKLWDQRMGLRLGQTQFCLGAENNLEIPEGYEVWKVGSDLPGNLVIVNAMTQYGYGKTGEQFVDYNAMKACFSMVRGFAEHTKLPVYFPLIGCGLGGGDWSEVCGIIENCLEGLDRTLVLNAQTKAKLKAETPLVKFQ